MPINEDAIRKGQAAQALMQHPDFILVVDTVRLEAFRAIANSDPSQKEAREQAYYLLLATDKIKNNLDALVGNAKFEEEKARKEEELNKQKDEENDE